MPRRSARGGKRTGTPGAAYAQRTDLAGNQPVRAAPSQRYGERVAAERAQRAVPLPAATPPPAAPAGPAGLRRPGPVAGGLGDPLRPSGRPGEPVTAGMFGAPMTPACDPVLNALRATMEAAPNERVAELLERLEGR